jgi:hypothetical protein
MTGARHAGLHPRTYALSATTSDAATTCHWNLRVFTKPAQNKAARLIDRPSVEPVSEPVPRAGEG